MIVNMLEAKSNLSKLIALLEDRSEDEIIIARNGIPAAKIIRFEQADISNRIGIADGMFTIPDDFDDIDIETTKLFEEGNI